MSGEGFGVKGVVEIGISVLVMYLSKNQNVFVQIAKYICKNWNMYLSKLLDIGSG